MKAEGLGSVKVNKNLTLDSVLYVPKLNCNLLSISKFTHDLHCETLDNVLDNINGDATVYCHPSQQPKPLSEL